MHRKTAVILAAAGGLIAAAVFLEHRAPASGTRIVQPPEPDHDPANVCGAPGEATAEVPFGHGTLTTSLSSAKILAGGDSPLYLSAALAVHDAALSHRPPLTMAIVIDRSGSMIGDRLRDAKHAAAGLVARLENTDRVALITYDDTAKVAYPLTVMDAAGRAALAQAIESISAAGGTNLHGGLMLGIDQVSELASAGGINRVILLSDGQANAGITDPTRIEGAVTLAANHGVRTTAVGVGIGFNEDLMEAIAESGRGHYYYVGDDASLEAVFAGELSDIQATVATAATLTLTPACAAVHIKDVHGYQFHRDGGRVVIPMADLAGGDARSILISLDAPSADLGARGLVDVTLDFDDVATGEHRSVHTRLGAKVVADAAAVEASINKDVMAQVVMVDSAEAMRATAEAYAHGDIARAREINRAVRDKADQMTTRYALPPEATAPALDNLESQYQGITTLDRGSALGQGLVKKSKAAARSMAKGKR